MRVRCYLPILRGERTIASIAKLTGINAGTLSRLENGVMLPADRDLDALQAEYGPIADWYPPLVLLALETDPDAEQALRRRISEQGIRGGLLTSGRRQPGS